MNTAVIRSDWIGRVIDGRFTLLQWLGSSGSSDVFLTEVQGDSPQKAAIKLISADAKDAELHVAHWALSARLSHPHLARLLYTGRFYFDTASFNYVVTEFAEESLSQILPERPLTPDETKEMLEPVLDALFYLHRRGFVHGHLKPSNILVVNDKLKLSADSLHVAGEFDEHFARPGVYDAPELATAAISPAADVWSLGITLVEALTQHRPLLDASTKGSVVSESIPQPFAGIAQECLRREPGRRCTLSDIRARLDKPVRSKPDRTPLLNETLPDRSLFDRGSESSETVLGTFRPRTLIAAAVLILLVIAAALLFRSRHVAPLHSPTADNQPAPAEQSPVPETPAPANGTPPPSGTLVKGEVLDRVLPDVPTKASRTIHGQVTVTVRVTVDASGNVSKATLDSPGPSRYFANLAEQAAHRWKFKPAQIDGKAVPSVWIIRFGFRETGTNANSVEVTH